MVYKASASANYTAYTNNGIPITETASASSNSIQSERMAYVKAYNLAYNLAKQSAISSANLANVILENIWDKITCEDLSKSSFNNHYINSSRYIQSPDYYKPVFKNIYPIPPRSKWQYDGILFKCTQSLEVYNSNYNFFDLIQKFIRPLNKYKIGVELSGGLDSSIIISMLIANGIEPFLIGFSCDRYEFRTERHIQSLYKNKVQNTILLDSRQILPFQNLLNCPSHQLPNPTSLYYFSKQVTAKHC